MKIKFKVPDECADVIRVLADAWYDGDVNAFARQTVLACLQSDLDTASDENRIDRQTYQKMLLAVKEAMK
jgi:hypothetical protein